MTIVIWLVVLFVSLYVLVKGADFFVEGAKHLGAVLGMSSFAIGVIIVGFGTSLPELAAAIAAIFSGETEIVVANAVGSNITNILLVVGILTVFGGRVIIQRDLIKTELPIFFISTTIFISVAFDGMVDRIESILLLGTFFAYIWYLFFEASDTDRVELTKDGRQPRLKGKSLLLLLGGMIAIFVGAKFSVEAVIAIATSLKVPIELITITAIALGTSLPELFVSIRAIRINQADLAIGNIFGSNVFNILAVVGIPGIIMPLQIGEIVSTLGIPILLAASAIFFVTGLARQIMRWEGIMMLLFYAFFMIKLFAFI